MAGENHPIRRAILLLAAGAILVVILARSFHARRGLPSESMALATNPATITSPGGPSTNADALRPSIDGTWRVLQSRPARARVQVALVDLRLTLRALPSNEASRRIRDFLASTNDTATGMEFKVGAGGALASAPTLRTFLLDELERIDPPAAAEVAKQLLASMNSSDEWALALRSLARQQTDPEGRNFTADKWQAMMRNETWMRNPSVGFLESFDIAVHLRDPELIPTLTDLVRLKDNQAVAHAAYLALDRLTVTDAAMTLAALAADPESMKGREVTRANYFARADVRDETQRRLVENYLLRPGLDAEELSKFTGLYPNANFMVSPNLVTKSETPDHAWLLARDQAALQQVEVWLQDSRFARLQPQLGEIARRLRQFNQVRASAVR